MRIYLASRSPRRRELLHQIGVDFETLIAEVEVDETPLAGEAPAVYVERVTRAKAAQGLQIIHERRLIAHPVLAADTTLEFNGEIIGKPVDAADAQAILQRLSGQVHRVITGVAVCDEQRCAYVQSISEVRFRAIDEDEIRHYVLSGEPMDKAGAYGIQGKAGLFVAHIAGSYTGIMGLPVCETGELLKAFGWRF
ncbi:nucleoside triphosphate pyrophosphatase [uncultured Azonexus sp.]|uniref:Maf family protein n=1 Tax=uncultured Azonexus sp. TaxID=520307 RepID=UPI0026263080|nr:Maf family protein [uncultured Azonexus sp.]